MSERKNLRAGLLGLVMVLAIGGLTILANRNAPTPAPATPVRGPTMCVTRGRGAISRRIRDDGSSRSLPSASPVKPRATASLAGPRARS